MKEWMNGNNYYVNYWLLYEQQLSSYNSFGSLSSLKICSLLCNEYNLVISDKLDNRVLTNTTDDVGFWESMYLCVCVCVYVHGNIYVCVYACK